MYVTGDTITILGIINTTQFKFRILRFNYEQSSARQSQVKNKINVIYTDEEKREIQTNENIFSLRMYRVILIIGSNK